LVFERNYQKNRLQKLAFSDNVNHQMVFLATVGIQDDNIPLPAMVSPPIPVSESQTERFTFLEKG
jgi:hypothetical protein